MRKKKKLVEFPEFLLSTTENSLRVSRAVAANKLRPLGNRLHTTHFRGDPSDLIRQNVWKIAALYFPGGLVADRTAFEMKPAQDGRVFLVADTKRSVELPGISFHARARTGRIEGDFPMRDGLYCSSRARAFVENKRPSRARSGVARTASRLEIEAAHKVPSKQRRGWPEPSSRSDQGSREIARLVG